MTAPKLSLAVVRAVLAYQEAVRTTARLTKDLTPNGWLPMSVAIREAMALRALGAALLAEAPPRARGKK